MTWLDYMVRKYVSLAYGTILSRMWLLFIIMNYHVINTVRAFNYFVFFESIMPCSSIGTVWRIKKKKNFFVV